MDNRKLHFYFWSVAAIGDGVSGGDRIFIEFAKYWSKKHKVTIYVWDRGLNICKKLGLDKAIEFKILHVKKIFASNFVLCYFARIIRAVFESLRLCFIPKLFSDNKQIIVYSSSEFLMDSLPVLILKIRYPGIFWVAAWYQTAPNPLKGFSEGKRENKYHLNAFLYWLSQFLIKPFIAKFADAVLVNNDNEKKHFPKQNNTGKTIAVLGAIDLNRITIWRSKNKIKRKIYDAVFQGRFHPQKGVLELIDIWKMVVSHKPKAMLAMIGDGPLMTEVRQKIREYGLQNNISLFGFVYDGPKKYKIFAQSKIVVHPAFYDSGGMASAEAMAFGLPGIGFNLSSYKLYYPKGMFKVEIGDLENFTKKILTLLDNDRLRMEKGKEAEQMIKNGWSWDRRSEEILKKLANFI